MHAQQERVDSLNYFNDTVFLTPVSLATKEVVLLIEAAPVSMPYYLSSLATVNQMRRLGEDPHGSRVYRRKSRVCGQYTRQDHPMETSERILQYYKIKDNKTHYKYKIYLVK